jgi:capsular polysaccharide biosynthesis protein
LQNTYQGIQDKLQNARVAVNFESVQGGERFSLLRASSASKLPVYPNRIGLILLGVVLGTLFAGIAVVLAEASDSNVRDTGDLPVLGDAPVLAAIPMIDNSRDRRMRRLRLVSWTAAYCVAISFVSIVVIHAVS